MNSFYYTIISDAETLSAKGLTSISLFSKLWAVKIHPHSPALVVLWDSRSCFRQSKSYILLNSRNPHSWLSSDILSVPNSRTIWWRYRFVIDIFRSGNSRTFFKRKLCIFAVFSPGWPLCPVFAGRPVFALFCPVFLHFARFLQFALFSALFFLVLRI